MHTIVLAPAPLADGHYVETRYMGIAAGYTGPFKTKKEAEH